MNDTDFGPSTTGVLEDHHLAPPPHRAPGKRESAWQSRLLPLMASILVLLTVFSCVVNVVEAYLVLHHIDTNHEIDLKPALDILNTDAAKLSPTERLVFARWKTLSILEVNSIESRYHQAAILVMTRVYIIFLGFATGMVLALVGAAFILGKLRESESQIGGKGAFGSVSIASASPGLVLACFGTLLMIFTISSKTDITVRDQSLYVPEPFYGLASEAVPDLNKRAAVPAVKNAQSQTGQTAAQKSILDSVREKLAQPAKP